MIGLLIDAYCAGRRDAAAGRPRKRPKKSWHKLLCIYRTGYRDEIRRMKEQRRLAQLTLDLET